jgi:hypothetical protein
MPFPNACERLLLPLLTLPQRYLYFLIFFVYSSNPPTPKETYRSRGILGADSRAGIAAILEILDFIRHSRFQRTLKIFLAIEEEIGCLGSRHIAPTFLQNVNAAFVVDRRGTRDIVTSYAGIMPFCDDNYGRIFETAGALAGMPDWKMAPRRTQRRQNLR